MTHQVAQKALAFWQLESAQIDLVAQRENVVFCVTDGSGTRYALRLHRPGYQTPEAMQSELAWMQSIGERGIAVPTPIPARDGRLMVELEGYHIDMLSWLTGRPLGATGTSLDVPDRAGVFREIGTLMAQLHNQADDWSLPQGFTRMAWDTDGLVGENPLWGQFWNNPALSQDQKSLLINARDKARQVLRNMELDYGLIHADMVRENILVTNEGLQVIDFDDCGFGYRPFDLATTLIKNFDEPDRDALQQALVEGYLSLRPVDEKLLPLFLMLRAFTYVGWIVPRIEEPGSQMRQKRFIKRATTLAEAFLSTHQAEVS